MLYLAVGVRVDGDSKDSHAFEFHSNPWPKNFHEIIK